MSEIIEQENFEEEKSFDFRLFKQKTTAFIKNNVYVLCAFAICIIYIFTALTSLERSSKPIIEIIGDIASGFVFAFSISRLLEGNGLLEGQREQEYVEAMAAYKASLLAAKPHYSKLQKWCLKYSAAHYHNRLDEILITTGLTHEQFIANEYDINKYSEHQRKAIETARSCKPIITTVEYLTSGANPNKKGEIDFTEVGVENYIKKSSKKDVISKILIVGIFGYWTIPNILMWNWSALIWALARTIVFVGFGVVKGFSAKIFVLEKLKAKVMDMSCKLDLFVSEVEAEEKQEGGTDNVHGNA